MIELEKEHEAFNAEFKNIGREYSANLNSVGFSGTLSANELGWLACAESKQAEIDSLKAQLSKYENKRFFSHDFNGDGFQYHDTLEEAQKEAEAGLDWYRDRVAGGHHVEDDGEFKELCFGIVLASADYNVDEVVTKEHHMNDDWTEYEVGTEILSLDFYEEPVKPSQENSHE